MIQAAERTKNMDDTIFKVNMRMGEFLNYESELANAKFEKTKYNEYISAKTRIRKR